MHRKQSIIFIDGEETPQKTEIIHFFLQLTNYTFLPLFRKPEYTINNEKLLLQSLCLNSSSSYIVPFSPLVSLARFPTITIPSTMYSFSCTHIYVAMYRPYPNIYDICFEEENFRLSEQDVRLLHHHTKMIVLYEISQLSCMLDKHYLS